MLLFPELDKSHVWSFREIEVVAVYLSGHSGNIETKYLGSTPRRLVAADVPP